MLVVVSGLPEPTPADVAARDREWTPWPEPHLVVDSRLPPAANLQSALAWLRTAP